MVGISKTLLLGAVIFALVCTSNLSAQQGNRGGGLRINLPFSNKVEWNPNGDYSIRPENGPWLVMCAAFTGERGELQAQDLVKELRTEFNLPAYVYRQVFDLSGPIEGKGWQMPEGEVGRPVRRQMRHLHNDFIVEHAVLVGDFNQIDDRKAKRTLNRIKRIHPRCLVVNEDNPTSAQSLGVLRTVIRRQTEDQELASLGPMHQAMMTPNPMLPDSYFAGEEVDHFIMNLNRDIEFSLLRCPKPFSVRVASFRGESTFEVQEIEEKKQQFNILGQLNKSVRDSKLAEGTKNAHDLTMALRERGIEAYEFHDRYESYVCVGSFEWVGRPLPNTETQELNPEILAVMKEYSAKPRTVVDPRTRRVIEGALQPRFLSELPGVQFDIQPEPVKVPLR